MVKSTIIILASLLLCLKMPAQKNEVFIENGLLSARLTLSPGTSLINSTDYFYLHGNIETYLTSKLSMAGEGYYYLNELASNTVPKFNYNHSAFFGANWHFTNKNNDLFIGFQPGLSFSKVNRNQNSSLDTQEGVSPLISSVIGYNYYVHKYFHFFLQTRFVFGQHFYDRIESLNEFRFSAGLGFNFRTKKKELSN